MSPVHGVILLTEYHANSIRLWRVLLLRSDIRLAPSGIRYASLEANRISLKPWASISLLRSKNITLCASKEYHLSKAEKREFYGSLFPHYSLFCFICIANAVGLCPIPLFKFSDTDNIH